MEVELVRKMGETNLYIYHIIYVGKKDVHIKDFHLTLKQAPNMSFQNSICYILFQNIGFEHVLSFNTKFGCHRDFQIVLKNRSWTI